MILLRASLPSCVHRACSVDQKSDLAPYEPKSESGSTSSPRKSVPHRCTRPLPSCVQRGSEVGFGTVRAQIRIRIHLIAPQVSSPPAARDLHRMIPLRAGLPPCLHRGSEVGFGTVQAQIRIRIQVLIPVPPSYRVHNDRSGLTRVCGRAWAGVLATPALCATPPAARPPA